MLVILKIKSHSHYTEVKAFFVQIKDNFKHVINMIG